MDFLASLYTDLLYRPVYNLVIFTYQTLPGSDMGLTIIYLALLVRIVLLPVSLTGTASSRRMQEIRPQLEKIERMADVGRRRELMRRVLKKNRINVYATAVVIGAQLLFLALLFQVFQSGLHHDPSELAYFDVDEAIDTTFFGLFDLSARNWWLPALTAAVTYVLLSLTTPEPEHGAKLSDVWYVIALPVFLFVILLLLPSAKSLFILTSILFSIALYLVAKYVFRVEPPGVADDVD